MSGKILRLRALALTGMVCMAGCATPMEVASITEVRPTNGAQGLDVYAIRRQKGEQVPEFAGDQLLEVRTYAVIEGKGETEIAGGNCTVSGSDFQATTVSPARVRVPLYRAQTRALSVSCTKDGYDQKSVVVEAFDTVRAGRMASGGSGGIIGLAVAVGADALADNTKNEWKYRQARLVMVAKGRAKTQ